MPYFAQSDLEDRLSARAVVQILDDNNDGTADTNPVDRLIADACSKVDSYLRTVYSLPLASPYPNEVVRLALDVAVAYAAQRHPDYVQRDWAALMEAAESDLRKLRRGETRLDVSGSPEPAANEGGAILNTSPQTDTPADKVFADGTGDF